MPASIRAGQRVAGLGPVHRHDQDVTALLDEAVLIVGRHILIGVVLSRGSRLATNDNTF